MIKYRVYDTQEKKYRDDLYFFIAPNGELLWSYELTDGLYPTDPQRFIIEQYTGLKDKNGVEIAEGDIVTIKHDNWDIQELRRVKYYGQFGYPAFDFSPSFDDVENGLSIVTQSDFYSVEVIGNIHENAELLEEER